MKELDAPKAGWASRLPAGPPDKVALARIVDADGGRDDTENSYYEHSADPDFVRIEAVLRRFPAVGEFRIIVTRYGELDEIEVEVECPEEQLPALEMGLREALRLRVPIRQVPAGSLPRFELKARRLVDRRQERYG